MPGDPSSVLVRLPCKIGISCKQNQILHDYIDEPLIFISTHRTYSDTHSLKHMIETSSGEGTPGQSTEDFSKKDVFEDGRWCL